MIRNESNEGSDAAGNLGSLTGDLLMILFTTTTRISMVVTIVTTLITEVKSRDQWKTN